MPDNTIPPAFREALDEPAPPPPPDEAGGEEDRPHHHHVFEIDLPVFAIYRDGSMVGNGWIGLVVNGWCWGASLVTAWLLGRGVWEWLAWQRPIGYRDGLVIGALTVVGGLLVIFLAVRAVLSPSRLWRLQAIVSLMAGMFLLSTLIVRAWLP